MTQVIALYTVHLRAAEYIDPGDASVDVLLFR